VNYRNKFVHLACLLLCVFALPTCGGGGSSGSKNECRDSAANADITAVELLDPTPCKRGKFGYKVVALPNGNVVVSDDGDSSIASDNGAVHLFNPVTQELIKSQYGEFKDALYNTRILPLANGNFVIRSPKTEDKDSVMLVNGQTGMSIEESIAGVDRFVRPLATNNFIISLYENGVKSSRLIDGTTGTRIGNDYRGENNTVSFSVTALENGNFALVSFSEITSQITVVESIRLFDGVTGVQIGNTIPGNNVGDLLGLVIFNHPVSYSDPMVKDLGNGNFVVASPNDIVAGVSGAGSVILVDGDTGLQIGSDLSGDKEGDLLGFNGVTVLSNGNFVISSQYDDHNGIENAGTVRLIDGATGALIGDVFSGSISGDNLGDGYSPHPNGITALPNGNFVIVHPRAGAVMLVDGTTGMQIGNTPASDADEFELGTSVVALSNNNFVVVSLSGLGIHSLGFVRLIDGSSGLQIGDKITAEENGYLGFPNIVTMPSGNFIIPNPFSPLTGATPDLFGGVILIDGTTGNQIGEIINGNDEINVGLDEEEGDYFDKSHGSVFALSNNSFVVFAENEGGKKHNSTIKLMDGATGLQIGQSIEGDLNNDTHALVIDLENTDYFILSLPEADINGLQNSGFVGVVPRQ